MSIPQHIRASVAIARADQHEGALDPRCLPRLRELLCADAEPLAVALAARRRLDGEHLLGVVRGVLPLTCQRCLACFSWPLRLQFDLRLVTSESDEQRLLAEADPYLVQDDRLPLQQIVEDEVLLALPMMPYCEACGCAQAQPEPRGERRASPFAQLKTLKHSK